MPETLRLRLALAATLAATIGASAPAVANSSAGTGGDIASSLALEQSLRLASSFADQESASTWLTSMSKRLTPNIKDPFYRHELLRLVHDAAIKAQLDPQLVLALIDVESSFNRFAVSVSGARGLMQVMPFWIKEIGHPSDNLFHPVTNLAYGCAILKNLLVTHKGNVTRALTRYNGGGDPDYARKVQTALRVRWAMPADSTGIVRSD